MSGAGQRRLIDELRQRGDFSDERVADAMLFVDRADFTDREPYIDSPQSIGYGATISAPHMHARALQQLLPVLKPDSHVLDVGSGSGYLAACFAKALGADGRVVGIEHIDELVVLSERNVRRHNADLLESGRLRLVVGDGRLGYSPLAPYDAIHVGAAAETPPQALVDQLAEGGRMVIPVGPAFFQQFMQIDKISPTEIRRQGLVAVAYVPLTSREDQLGRP